MPYTRKPARFRFPARTLLGFAILCGLAAFMVFFAPLVVARQELLRENTAQAVQYDPSAPEAASTPEPAVGSPPEERAAVFVGEANTAGLTASAEQTRWVSLVSADQGWRVTNLGRPLTGYVSTSQSDACGFPDCLTFEDVIDQAKALAPDVIVIAGGHDDFWEYNLDPARVDEAIQSTLGAYRAAFPNAELIVVGPSTANEFGAVATGMNDSVRITAEDIGATFVDLLDPPALNPSMAVDGANLNDEGQRIIASRVLETLS